MSVNGCAEILECHFSGVTIYGRVWRKGCGKPGFEVCVGVHVIMCECVWGVNGCVHVHVIMWVGAYEVCGCACHV